MAGVYAYPGGGTPGRDHLGAGAAPSLKQEIFGPAYPLDWSRRHSDPLILCVPFTGSLGSALVLPVDGTVLPYRYGSWYGIRIGYGYRTVLPTDTVRCTVYSIPGAYSIYILVLVY